MSPRNREFLEQQQEYFNGFEHLIEKAPAEFRHRQPKDAAEIIDKFDLLQVDKIILSKMDEN